MDNILEFPDSSLIEKEAATWMVMLDGDTPLNPSQRLELQQWMAISPSHRDELERLAELWGLLNVLTVLAVPLEKTQASLGQRFAQALRAQVTTINTAVTSTRAIAAATLLGVGSLVFTTYFQAPAFNTSNGLYQTAIGQQSTATLSDNSSIILNTNSKVRVEYTDSVRKIYLLQGEAHFDVASNKKVPFQVYAGDGLVQAVGTAFTVYLQQDEVVKVTVTEGKVKVLGEPLSSNSQQGPSSKGSSSKGFSSNGPANNAGADNSDSNNTDSNTTSSTNIASTNTGTSTRAPQQANPLVDLATLKAGQIGTLERIATDNSQPNGTGQQNKSSFLQTLQAIDQQELDRQLAWHSGLVMFAGETLEQVVHEISRYSPLNIQITDPSLKTLKIGGQFRIGETSAMFDVLESNFNIQVSHLANGHVQLSRAELSKGQSL
ncbi:FecR domain-containing protein [Porticoccaceae bacterium]|nr:FecR domain-containing protein [Porticoccaceae bacterium]